MKHVAFILLLLISYTASSQSKIGKPIKDIKLPGPTGEEIKISTLQGKVVLVDFWASWCVPCRNNNPNLVKLYAEYKDKGFEIYAVSIDQQKSDWIQAVAADKMFWKNVIDTDGWKSYVLYYHNVRRIPSNIVVDKKGVIRAFDVPQKELSKTITDLLAE
jgi:peroxiredoxin